MAKASHDVNRVPTLIGVSTSDGVTPILLEVDPTTGELLVKATLSQDIEIGAVEIKNSTDDTRATVGANGLYVDIRNIQTGTNSIGQVTANAGTNLNTSALATSAKQDTLLTELQLKADLTETQPVSIADSVTVNTELPAAAALSDTKGNPTTPMIGAALMGYDVVGAVWERLITDASGRLVVADGDGSLTVDATNLDIRDLVVGDIVSAEPDGTALSNGQVAVDTTAGGTTIIAASAGRQGIAITNQGSVACYVGTGTVTTSNGFLLSAGESIALPTDSDVKAITASGSTTVGYLAYA